jgi:glycosyltransferase involved in cell wall biosynthesis
LNILFLSAVNISNINQRNIYTDLIREFVRNEHNVFAVSPVERRFKKKTLITGGHNYQLLQVQTLNLQKTNIIEKGLTTLFIGYQFKRGIKKYFGNINFDLIVHSTPPITFTNVIKFYKNKYGSNVYLLLKDIFPQNAVDLGYFKKKSLIYKYFKSKENKLYKISDFIGCMSPANKEYLLSNNPLVSNSKVDINPNSIELIEKNLSSQQMLEIKKRYDLPIDKTIFIYGGNLGEPQGIPFLLDVIESNKNNSKIFFLIIGSGTHFHKIYNSLINMSVTNVVLYESLNPNEYRELVICSDVGLIFLDQRFTIPNFPSRLLSYLENKKPVLAATDMVTDIGEIMSNNKFGYWVESGDLKSYNNYLNHFTNSPNIIDEMGNRGYQYLTKNYTVESSYNIIMNHFSN